MRTLSKKKLIRWNQSAGGIFFPTELELMSNVFLEDRCPTHGLMSIYAYPEGHREAGHLLELMPGQTVVENLIVNVGRAALATLSRATAAGILPTGAIGVYDLGYLAVGKGSSGGGSLPDPLSVALYSETTGSTVPPGIILRPLMTVTTPPPGPPFMTNLWTGQIGSTQLNLPPDNIINEAGIYCLNQTTLFSFRTFANQTKSVGFVFEVRWTHLF